MVFLVQNTQNRDARALHLKLDEILRTIDAAPNKLINVENCTDEELDKMERQFKALRAREDRKVKAHENVHESRPDAGREDCVNHGLQTNFRVSGTLPAAHG